MRLYDKRGIWLLIQHLLWDKGKPRIDMVCRRTSPMNSWQIHEPHRPSLSKVLLKNSTRNLLKTQHIPGTKTNPFMLFRKTIGIDRESCAEQTRTSCGRSVASKHPPPTFHSSFYGLQPAPIPRLQKPEIWSDKRATHRQTQIKYQHPGFGRNGPYLG